ncbi:hypothetical protein HaLaN_24800 [Haematococcus lacustris]|uniref:Uncharacterized protein n=1 Tax=Haematococcus lacustris TaxID=44745 RepID=A0A699ZVD2_HAELA|nr:hypothetical protein HaLaN_24800 [Haematococcus lacustris]
MPCLAPTPPPSLCVIVQQGTHHTWQWHMNAQAAASVPLLLSTNKPIAGWLHTDVPLLLECPGAAYADAVACVCAGWGWHRGLGAWSGCCSNRLKVEGQGAAYADIMLPHTWIEWVDMRCRRVCVVQGASVKRPADSTEW